MESTVSHLFQTLDAAALIELALIVVGALVLITLEQRLLPWAADKLHGYYRHMVLATVPLLRLVIIGIALLLALPKAVASSTALHFIRQRLAKTRLIDYFGPHLYSADQVANGKPHPDLFLFAAEKIGFAPADCTVVEDSENGVIAGVRAGMRVIGFTGGGHYEDKAGQALLDRGAERCVSTFDDLRDLLAS